MEIASIQINFFQHLKSLLPQHTALVDTVAELLNISNDSAYRRIRGEKPITLEEIQKLAIHFKVSLDQFLHLQSDSFVFSGRLTYQGNSAFDEWLTSIHQNFSYLNTFKSRHLYFLTKDIPFSTHFQIPELASFKYFFWKRTILQDETMKGLKFSIADLNTKTYELGKKVVEEYNKIPCTEVWNIESINSTIRQIEYYKEAKLFNSPSDIIILYEKVEELIGHLEKQAETGKKFMIGHQPTHDAADYNLLHNDLILGDNSFLAVADDTKIAFISHSVINYVVTRDERFCNYRFKSVQNLISKSTQISKVGEKERSRFFNRFYDKIRLSSRL
jgi:plasmid maintenance system antidote protein VapI